MTRSTPSTSISAVHNRKIFKRIGVFLNFFIALMISVAPASQSLAQNSPVASATLPVSKDIIWFETPVAEITVGRDPLTNQSFQRSFYLAYIGPARATVSAAGVDVPKAMEAARECAETVRPIRTQLQNQLSLIEARSIGFAPSERVKRKISETNAALLFLAGTRSAEFFVCVRGKGFSQLRDSDFYLALVQRNCTATACPKSKSQTRLSNDDQSKFFASLYEWVASKVAVENRTSTGVLVRLDTLTNPDESASLKTGVTQAREVNDWIKDPSPVLGAERFSHLIDHIREKRRIQPGSARISPFAPIVLGMGRDDILTVSDALHAPVEAYALAPSSAARLTKVSNEIVRAQIFDCRYFRGKVSIQDLSACSGVALTDTQLSMCLNGSICRPTIPSATQIQSILAGAPLTLQQIAGASPFGRAVSGDLKSLKAKYDQCLAKGGNSISTNSCFSQQLLTSSPALQMMGACLSKAGALQQTTCALKTTQPGAEKALNCVSGKTEQQSIGCVVGSYLPEREQKLYECLSTTAGSRVNACGQLLGGDAGRLAQCARQANASNLSLVACAAGNKLDENQRAAVACATSSGSLQSAAICIAATKMPPKLAQQIGCITQSQGSPVAAGVCIATSTMSLTPEQQLALQCLASSGGQPYVFAACFGGQLTMKEMVQCKGKKFNEGNCFGDNNEFQKVAKALTGKTISSNSVVGQIMTVHITPAAYAFSAVQPHVDDAMADFAETIDDAKSGLEALAKGDFGGLAESAGNIIVQPYEKTKDFVCGILGC